MLTILSIQFQNNFKNKKDAFIFLVLVKFENLGVNSQRVQCLVYFDGTHNSKYQKIIT